VSLVFGAWGEGSSGRLDLVAIQDRALWHTQVLPGLLGKVKGAKAKASSAFAGGLAHAAAATKQVTFKVSDAGKPLKGASVKVVGAGAKKTNAKGRTTFTLKAGRYKVNVKKGGYSPSRLRIKVG
jgi:hypothetical protein